MMKIWWLLIPALLLVWPATSGAEETWVGSVKQLKGSAEIERQGKVVRAEVGTRLFRNDTIRTGDDGSVGLIMTDNSVLSLGPGSRLTISEYVFDPAGKKTSFTARMLKGTAVYLSGLIAKLNQRGVRFETQTAVMGIRGTRFAIQVKE